MQLGSLQEVIDQYIYDGQSIALEGFTHLIPFAAGHEILRQKKRDLHLIRMTPDLIYDQLIGAGCARALTFSWGGNPGVGSLHRLRDAVENDWPRRLTIHEHSHAGMAVAYTAGAARLPFGMLRGYVGTDLSGVNAQIREVRCPYTNEMIATVPRSIQMLPSCTPKPPIARATFSFAALLVPRKRRPWRQPRSSSRLKKSSSPWRRL